MVIYRSAQWVVVGGRMDREAFFIIPLIFHSHSSLTPSHRFLSLYSTIGTGAAPSVLTFSCSTDKAFITSCSTYSIANNKMTLLIRNEGDSCLIRVPALHGRTHRELGQKLLMVSFTQETSWIAFHHSKHILQNLPDGGDISTNFTIWDFGITLIKTLLCDELQKFWIHPIERARTQLCAVLHSK